MKNIKDIVLDFWNKINLIKDENSHYLKNLKDEKSNKSINNNTIKNDRIKRKKRK